MWLLICKPGSLGVKTCVSLPKQQTRVWVYVTLSAHNMNRNMLPLPETLPPLCVFPPSDINLAGEPKPHRSKTVKRSAGDMYRWLCSQQPRSNVSNYSGEVLFAVVKSLHLVSALPTVHLLIWTTTFKEITMIGKLSILYIFKINCSYIIHIYTIYT